MGSTARVPPAAVLASVAAGRPPLLRGGYVTTVGDLIGVQLAGVDPALACG